ncbi:MAG TPA: DNA N-6-adenine-methyltransferase [Solirubrobacterales bacterium]|nr:DNA N-6-adenine-methyltransferase [Solirubrobacterales bacterium]
MATAVATSRLAELEETIGRGLETFVEVGEALREIRDGGLYLEKYLSFEDYCEQRWQMKRRRAYELMEASTVAEQVSEFSHTAPANEAQAKQLAPLREQPEEMVAAWEEASADGEPTAAKVKEAVARRMDVHFSSATDDWATPQDLFDKLNAEFGFQLDVCASNENAKCSVFYTAEQDGLAQPWTGTCWMNPPYGVVIGKWVAKARESAVQGATVVCLVPARVDTAWFQENCPFGEIRFLRGRVKFGGSENSAPFPSAIVVFGPHVEPGKVRWGR